MMSNQLTGYQDEDQTITLNYENSKSIILKILTSEIVQVFQDHGCPTNSYAIEGDKQRQTNYTVENQGDHVEIRTSDLIMSMMLKIIHSFSIIEANANHCQQIWMMNTGKL